MDMAKVSKQTAANSGTAKGGVKAELVKKIKPKKTKKTSRGK